MLYRVVIQKIVIGKPKPKESDRVARRRVVVVEADTSARAEKVVRTSAEIMGPDTTGEILAIEPVPFAVLCA